MQGKKVSFALAAVALALPASAGAVATDVHVTNTSSDPVLSSIVAPVELSSRAQVGINPQMNSVGISSTANTVRVDPAQTLRVAAVAVPFTRGGAFNLAGGANRCVTLTAPGTNATWTYLAVQSNGPKGYGYAEPYVTAQPGLSSQGTVGALLPFQLTSMTGSPGFAMVTMQITSQSMPVCVWNGDAASHFYTVVASGTSTS